MGSRRLWIAISALLSVGLACLFVATSDTFASFVQGKITNSANTNGGGSLSVTHSYTDSKPPFSGTITCTQVVANVTAKTCTSGIQPSTGTTVSGSTSTDSITNNGTLPSSRLSTQIQASTGCLPVAFVNGKAATATKVLLPRNQIRFQQTDRWGTTSAANFSGTAYATSPFSDTSGGLLGSNFAIGIWFKTATNGYALGGGLLSLSPSQSNVSSAGAAPMLWMDNAGKIHAQVPGTGGSVAAATSAAAYNDGNWHFAVLSVASVILSTPTLYVDGTSVSGIGLSLLAGGATSYWHAAWGDFTGISGAPTSNYFDGSLSGGFVASASVSSGTVSSLFTQTSAANYKTAVLALGSLQYLWMFDDTGTTTYAGAMPASMTNPCSMLTWSVGFTNPTGTLAGTFLLEATSGTNNDLAGTSFTWEPMGPVPTSAGGTAQIMTMTLGRVGASPPTGGTTYNTDISGLHLYLPYTYTLNSYPRTGVTPWSQAYTWNDAYSAFIA